MKPLILFLIFSGVAVCGCWDQNRVDCHYRKPAVIRTIVLKCVKHGGGFNECKASADKVSEMYKCDTEKPIATTCETSLKYNKRKLEECQQKVINHMIEGGI